MKKIFAYFGYVLSVALVGALTACNPQETITEDTASLSIKTFFPAKVVTNQPMTVNGNGLDEGREVVFPGGVSVTDIEHVGDGIQKNIYNLGGHDIRIYDVFPIDPVTSKFVKRYNYEDTVAFCEKYGFQYVPVIDDHFRLPADVQELLVISTAKTVYGNNLSHLREGLVLRRRDDFSVSFKAKSPDYKI